MGKFGPHLSVEANKKKQGGASTFDLHLYIKVLTYSVLELTAE